MDWIGPAIHGITALVGAIDAVAPSVAMAITGGRSVEDWGKTAHEALAKLKNRESQGDWDRDLDDRKERG